jgi:hypothetical protein
LKLKPTSNIQSINVQPNEPTNFSLKQPLGESKELIINKTPSIDILPSKQRTSQSNKILKTNIVLPERISKLDEQNLFNEDTRNLDKYSRHIKSSKTDHIMDLSDIEEQKFVLKSKSNVKDLFEMSTKSENYKEETKEIEAIEKNDENENEPQKSVWKQKKFLK